jgi:hypothetical protein
MIDSENRSPDTTPEPEETRESIPQKWRGYVGKLQEAVGLERTEALDDSFELDRYLDLIHRKSRGGAPTREEREQVKRVEAEIQSINEALFRHGDLGENPERAGFIRRFEHEAGLEFMKQGVSASRRLHRHAEAGESVEMLDDLPPEQRLEILTVLLLESLETAQVRTDRQIRAGKIPYTQAKRRQPKASPRRKSKPRSERQAEVRAPEADAIESALKHLSPTEQKVLLPRLGENPSTVAELAYLWGYDKDQLRRIIDHVEAKFNRIMDEQAPAKHKELRPSRT